jgi:tetratricopeptide (TPR) repeat protein
MVNLAVTITSAWRRVTRYHHPAAVADLVVALLTRGRILGRIDDVQSADDLTAGLVTEYPEDGLAHLARARTDTALHRFDAALARLEQAEAHAAPALELAEERATILQALGRSSDAWALWNVAAGTGRDSHVLGRLACLQAERGAREDAQALLAEAVATYPGVSPIPLACLFADWAHVHEHAGDQEVAESAYRLAVDLLPGHARAQLGVATAEARSGRVAAAVERLHPVCAASDDPAYTGALGLLLRGHGTDSTAAPLLAWAHQRFNRLMVLHPEAFADHAAAFRRAAESDRRSRTDSVP